MNILAIFLSLFTLLLTGIYLIFKISDAPTTSENGKLSYYNMRRRLPSVQEGKKEKEKVPYDIIEDIHRIKSLKHVEDRPHFEEFHPPSLRNLPEENTIASPGIFAFNLQNGNGNYEYYAYKHILSNVQRYSSDFIIYPYGFNYTYTPENTTQNLTVLYDQGAVISLKPVNFPPNDTSLYYYFQYLKTATDVKFGKAKALYDMNIAVLKFTTIYDEYLKDLFYESDSYCNILGTYIGKFPECLIGKSGYTSFKSDPRNAGKTAFVFIDEKDIKSGFLFEEGGENLFGMVIVPDHILGTDDLIKSLLGNDGIERLKQYVSNGGMLLATGKSGYLLETWGMISEKSYNTSHLLVSGEGNRVINYQGCESSANSTAQSGADFFRQLMCMNVPQGDKLGYNFLVSSYPMFKETSNDTNVLFQLNRNNSNLRMTNAQTGITTKLTQIETEYLPFFLKKDLGKGKMLIINGNPLFKSWYKNLFFNVLHYAMAKNVVFNSYVSFGEDNKKPIPGGEAGVLLDVKIEFMNLYDSSVTDFELHIWLPQLVAFTDYPKNFCAPSNANITKVTEASLNQSTHIRCFKPEIGKFEKFETTLKVEILDQSVTQKKFGILLIYPIAYFTEKETGVRTFFDKGGVKVDAALAALLRGALNPDPSSFYPLPGKGVYVDNVLQVENKEDTSAVDVEYIGIVPIVSPVVDGGDQAECIRTCSLYNSYYQNKYKFPFTKDDDYDEIDVRMLNEKDIIMVAEWDLPVKQSKFMRNSSYPVVNSTTESIDIMNLNYATIVDNPNTVLRQIYFKTADKFFEHATQRLMAFVDTAKEKGAKAQYPSGIPSSVKNPNKPSVAKKEFIWSRLDVYFYDAKEYQMPKNVNSSHVFSIDRYPKLQKPCVQNLGDARAEIMQRGYFNDTQPGGLKANEYSNELFQYCAKNKIDITNPTSVSDLTKGSIVPIHYLIPVKDPEILQASDILEFTENSDKSGYLTAYPEVKFIFAHKTTLIVEGGLTRQGGKLEIQLPSSVIFKNTQKPVEEYLISYSADQVAFYKTIYDQTTNTLTSFFKRGLMPNEAYGKPSVIGLNIEGLSSINSFESKIKIYEVKYDVSSETTGYENYFLKKTLSATFTYDRFFSLPAIEVHIKVNRKNSSEMKPYELMEPYTRFGVYIQELLKHRTVWGSAESHHTTDPGLQAINGGFSVISNLGISSIPFVEYLTTGPGLLIPSSPSTSRLEWKDIWNRKWSQPLRSVFPDVPPIPPPLKNFMMTTTFELTQNGGYSRLLEWPSDEEAEIRVQIKLLNNYPKYFQITTCKDNEVDFFPEDSGEKARIFDPPPYAYQINETQAPDETYHIKIGHRATYGVCFDSKGTYLSGKQLQESDFENIRKAYLCAQSNDPKQIEECAKDLSSLSTVSRRDPTQADVENWNYSPEVSSYYPVNYIKPNMWDLTHYDYDDNPMDKSYKYHMDNNLPSLDKTINKPHNIIAQPIFKGFGYNISYDNNKSLKRFGQYRGWWSDNLQNKDHTLLAGQGSSNDCSVHRPTLLAADRWINIRNLTNPKNSKLVESRLKNIYACLFNQNRIKMSPKGKIYAYPNNVYQNNIVPIIPELDKNDKRLSNYNCTGQYQYIPENISLVDNIVETPTIRDWMYFAANLRGNALENLNILFTIKPFPGIKYEGITKVQDGGRFVYWNPANGPNSFLIVDNPVNTVESKRSDLEIDCEVFPRQTTTFKANTYNLFSISDPAEIKREWKMDIYTNSYGFGDSTVSIYVGGTQKTSSILQPGQNTFIKITFYNNAGFDWNMLFEAIDFENKPAKPLNADALLNRYKHAIQVPLRYNFLTLDIPNEIKDHITIIPSDHNVDVAPQFFDFQNINVVSIRDGFKGDYYYKMTIKPSFPDSLRGKPIEIPIRIEEKYFDKLPGYNDPTGGFHNYKLQIPSIKFGVPYNSGIDKGKVFYTSGYSKDLIIDFEIPIEWQMKEFRMISEEQISQLRIAAGDMENYNRKLSELWDMLDSRQTIPFSTADPVNGRTTIKVNMTDYFPTFPKSNGSSPDIAKFYVLGKANAYQLEYGSRGVIADIYIVYKNWRNRTLSTIAPQPWWRTVNAKGAWLKVTYVGKVLMQGENSTDYIASPDQRIFATDSGVIQATLTAKNIGTDVCYNTNFTVVLEEGVELMKEKMNKEINYVLTKNETKSVLLLNTKRTIGVGEPYSEVIYLQFGPSYVTTRQLQGTPPTSRNLISKVTASIDLTENLGDIQVAQEINSPYTLYFQKRERDILNLEMKGSGSYYKPKIWLNATAIPEKSPNGYDVRFIFYRKIMTNLSNQTNVTFVPKWEALTNFSKIHEYEDTPIPEVYTGKIDRLLILYKVESFTETKGLLASTIIDYDTDKMGMKWWIILLITFGSLVIVLGSGLLIYFLIVRKAVTATPLVEHTTKTELREMK